ncbi:hypothetical protein QE152_g32270 [Popillia japonica]|uniref:Uncharacterized protein n=1 Tax=Popillia japonica TaxID=7064 RepID=A0AAW1IZV3_POPJA
MSDKKNKWVRKYLRQEELEDIIAHLSESEDDYDGTKESDEESDLYQEIRNSISAMPIEFEDGLVIEDNNIENNEEYLEEEEKEDQRTEEEVENEGSELAEASDNLQQMQRDPKKEAKELKERYKNILWRKRNLIKFATDAEES